MKTRVFIAIVVLVSVVFLSTSAQGVVIPLSTHTSEPSGPNSVPASWMDASMNLSVTNNGQWELSVAVTNLTPENAGDFAFKMTELYFNTTAPITSLSLDSVSAGSTSDWTLTLDTDNIQADGFGLYDISIISNDITSVWIDSLETLTFGILIDGGAASYEDTDFYALSAMDSLQGHILAYGAAKFVKTGDPLDLSAYGAYVPEPATILMLGLGALALLRKRRS
ncbi:MAG: PEP-CTERM sorting domain-containing protein [Planctomycetota bacterium]